MSELPVNQPEGTHCVTVVQDGDSYLVRCNECKRLFRIDFSGVYETLVRGDQMASHSFNIGGLVTQGITVRTEADSNIERLLDNIDIDL